MSCFLDNCGQGALIAISTYNEIENLPSLVEAIHAAAPEADLLVIDDNSPDGTGDWAEAQAAEDERLSVLRRPGKLGLGTAAVAAIEWAIRDGYETLATLDADWSHPPDKLPELLALLSEADVAIGSRYCPGGRIEGWPLHRRVMSKMVNGAARTLLRLPVTDASGAFRAYRVETLRELDLGKLQSTGYAYLEELLWMLKHAGARFAELPITFTERRAGASKINSGEAIAAARLLLRLGREERRLRR